MSLISHSLFIRIAFLIYFCTLLSSSAFSQDTLRKQPVHSPRKALIFSAVIPGLGQAYNKKYWKIPVVYTAIGTTTYFFTSNNKLYKDYKQAYINKTDEDPATIDNFPYYNETQIRELQDYYRRFRDLNIILTGLFYTLNIVDAYVDAHLTTFDVSDNLTMNIQPALILSANKKPAAGLTLSLKF